MSDSKKYAMEKVSVLIRAGQIQQESEVCAVLIPH